MLLPDHIHGSSTRFEKICRAFNLAHVSQNTLPHCLEDMALKVSTKTKAEVLFHFSLNGWERRAYPHLLSEAFLLFSELHCSAAPRAKVLRCSNHLSILKLQIPHQQLHRNRKCDTTFIQYYTFTTTPERYKTSLLTKHIYSRRNVSSGQQRKFNRTLLSMEFRDYSGLLDLLDWMGGFHETPSSGLSTDVLWP